jgi:hypothetical protein
VCKRERETEVLDAHFITAYYACFLFYYPHLCDFYYFVFFEHAEAQGGIRYSMQKRARDREIQRETESDGHGVTDRQ